MPLVALAPLAAGALATAGAGALGAGTIGASLAGGLGSLAASKALGQGSSNSGGVSNSSLQNTFGTPNNTYSRNPAWVNEASQTNYNNAATAANKPYQAYTGQQVAPLSANQQQAQQAASASTGAFKDVYGNITDYLNQAAQPNNASYTPASVGYNNVNSTNNQQSISAPATWDASAAQQYMSPYIAASLQPQIQNLNQQYALQQNQANAQAAGAGSFGGSRQAVLNALINKQQNQDIQNVTAQGYNTAYNTGLGAFQNANNQNLAAQTEQANIYGQNNAANLQAQLANQQAGINTGEYNQGAQAAAFNENQNIVQQNKANELAAATGLTNFTTAKQANKNAMINNLMTTGAAGQTTQQAQDTANYQNYLNQLYYPEQQASYLQGLLGSGANTGSISTGYNAGNSGVANAANIGGQIINSGLGNAVTNGISGLFGGGSSSSSATPWINPDTSFMPASSASFTL